MREANIISILGGFRDLTADLFTAYLSYYSIKIKSSELADLKALVNILLAISQDDELYDKYFIGYTIPQISKEFDLLRIDDFSIVNIELKRTSTPEKIRAQLLRNRYYLSFLKKEIHTFTFDAESEAFYSIDQDGILINVDASALINALSKQKVKKITDIDSYFNPSNYLVSPFNSTTEFIEGKYFLTVQQEEIYKILKEQIGVSSFMIASVRGKAGTGKTLLTYHLAKEFSNKVKVAIFHCGLLNNGHKTLIQKYGWSIFPIRIIRTIDVSQFRLIIIDEVQRIYPTQLELVLSKVKEHSIACIFSYDSTQTLRSWEIKNDIPGKIESELTVKSMELTSKIRTNKEVSSFIKCLFNKSIIPEKYEFLNIELSYFDRDQHAKSHLLNLKDNGWKVINYTPDKVTKLPYEKYILENDEDNAHTVIGQEFDNVVAVIDEHFYYKKNTLSTRNYKKTPYYHPTKMLFQIVSRTRIKLAIVVVRNPEILNRCLEILAK